MDRKDFYYRQLVDPSELNSAFDAVEQGIQSAVSALQIRGLAQGGEVTQRAPTPNLTVQVAGPVLAYDESGNRILVPSNQVVDVSIDENSATTAVNTAGQERYLSLFVKFDRVLSDPRSDGDGQPVFFARTESFKLVVVAGAAAPAGTAARPALRGLHILLADIKLVYGQTAVQNADITTTRTQYVYRITGTPLSFNAKSFQEVAQKLVDAVNVAVSTSGAGKAVLSGGNAFDGNQSISGHLDVSGLLKVYSNNVEIANGSLIADVLDGITATVRDALTVDAGYIRSNDYRYATPVTRFRVVPLACAPLIVPYGSANTQDWARTDNPYPGVIGGGQGGRVRIDLTPYLIQGAKFVGVHLRLKPGTAEGTPDNRIKGLLRFQTWSEGAGAGQRLFDMSSVVQADGTASEHTKIIMPTNPDFVVSNAAVFLELTASTSSNLDRVFAIQIEMLATGPN